MIYLKSKEEIELMKLSSLLVGETLAEVARHIRPGISTLALDKIAEEFIRDNGATPEFKGYNGFPASLCISINEVVVHGIPSNREIQEKDIVSIDCGTRLNNWVGDSAYTFALDGIDDQTKDLMRTTKESLYLAIEKSVVGNRIGDLSYQVQSYCEGKGYGVVRELCGHGLGKNMHEDPQVSNYGRKGTGVKFKEGMTIAIEPMITLGNRAVVFENDGWTCRTKDRKVAAHYEHDIAITKDGPIILSSFDSIEKVIKENNNLELV